MFVEAETDAECAEELVGHHGHLVLRQPLGVLIREAVEKEVDGDHVEEGIAEELEPLVARQVFVDPGVRRVHEGGSQEAGVPELVIPSSP